MIVVTSANGVFGIRESMRVLKAGGSAIDAVEAGIRLVEANPDDHTVGYSGFPNILGEVELDASIMDGATLLAGAVGALRNYKHPISIARKALEVLPHVLLVGIGAERFADEMGYEKEDLLTKEASEIWAKGLLKDMPNTVFEQLNSLRDLYRWVKLATDPEKIHGTVNFIAQDINGNICTGVSTSGWAWKYPGRLGDSPVIGAGNYAHNKYGAAACTGLGEMAIRACTARSVVLYMKMGMTVEQAGQAAMNDLNELGGNYLGEMNIIAIDHTGKPAAFSNFENATFAYITDQMDDPVVSHRSYVANKMRWNL